jgi:hypothetical protein
MIYHDRCRAFFDCQRGVAMTIMIWSTQREEEIAGRERAGVHGPAG